MTYTDDTRNELQNIMNWAKQKGIIEVTINAGKLGEALGLYDSNKNNVKSVCDAMKSMMKEGDKIVDEPPSGEGASVTIKYKVP